MALTLELSLFKNYTPNIDGAHFFAPSSQETFYNALKNSNKFIKTLTLDNYRINANVIKVNLTNDLLLDINNISYAIEATYDGQTFKTFKCWHVKEVEVQSGYIVLSCDVDLWQTYINNVTFKNTIIERTNKDLSDYEVGYYDPIQNTIGDMTIKRFNGSSNGYTEYGIDYLWVVVLVQYNISQAVFGDNKISRTELYGINLQDLYNLADVASGDLGYQKPPLDVIISIIGGVYKVSANVGNNDAQILKTWIVPNEVLNTAGYGITLTAKSIFFEHATDHEKSFNVELVLPNNFTKKCVIDNYDVNKVYYGGTYNNGLKLVNYTTDKLEYNTIFITTDDELQILAQQGERQQDITNGFEIKLTTNGSTTTTWRHIAGSLSKAISIGTGASRQIALGGAGASMGALSIVGGIAGLVNDFGIESARGNGDGYLSYWNSYNQYWRVKSPYVITSFESTHNEIIKARNYGATFNMVLNDMDPLIFLNNVATFLKPQVIETRATYLKGETTATGAPLNACIYISNAIKNGVHYFTDLVVTP